MDREAWWGIVHGVTKSQTQLRAWACIHAVVKSNHVHIYSCLFLSSLHFSEKKNTAKSSGGLAMWWTFGKLELLFSGSVVSDFATPWTAASQASLPFTTSQSLLKLMSIESVMPSNQLVLCRPLVFLPSVFPSIRVFSNESVLWSGGQSTGVSATSSALPMNIRIDFI